MLARAGAVCSRCPPMVNTRLPGSALAPRCRLCRPRPRSWSHRVRVAHRLLLPQLPAVVQTPSTALRFVPEKRLSIRGDLPVISSRHSQRSSTAGLLPRADRAICKIRRSALAALRSMITKMRSRRCAFTTHLVVAVMASGRQRVCETKSAW